MPERPTNLDNSRARNSCLSAHYGCFSHSPPISQLLVIPSHNEVGEGILGLSRTYVCTYVRMYVHFLSSLWRPHLLSNFDITTQVLGMTIPRTRVGRKTLRIGWLVDFGFNGPLRQYFSLYRAVSQREGERGKQG